MERIMYESREKGRVWYIIKEEEGEGEERGRGKEEREEEEEEEMKGRPWD